MKVFIFTGQGSQQRGMGGQLFDEFPELTEAASDILGYSIKALCLDDPDGLLDQTRYTQPAIYVVNALAYFQRLRDGAQADGFAGHSLGEFNALLAAQCFDFAQGLRLVQRRAELMNQVSGGEGGMAAIMNLRRHALVELLQAQQADGVDLAIHNAPLQSVIAGPKAELARLESAVEAAGGMLYPLNTSGAFHSRYMQPIADAFCAYLQGLELAPPNKPVIANVSAQPYSQEAIADNLVRQLTHPVQWCESIQYLLAQGEVQFEEVGHGEVLTKLVEKIRAGSRLPVPGVAVSPRDAAPGPREAALHSAIEQVAQWNARHPAGTRVRSLRVDGDQLTRSTALVLLGHRAAVYLQGHNGYFALDEIQAL
ncbi:ACP S-malonyltransferase [Pseudomonas sp. B11]